MSGQTPFARRVETRHTVGAHSICARRRAAVPGASGTPPPTTIRTAHVGATPFARRVETRHTVGAHSICARRRAAVPGASGTPPIRTAHVGATIGRPPTCRRRAFQINLPAQTNHPRLCIFPFPTRPNKSCSLRRATPAQKYRHNSTYSVQMCKKSRCILQSCTALTVRMHNIMRVKYNKSPKMKRFNTGT